ncbi:unnamed protein product [Linum trigynum]|uniref:Kinesin motor domain-containing protein n=1 Tax=Linum trigynum TaxID=586398 RepID=A0AAV2DF47_9ROSI
MLRDFKFLRRNSGKNSEEIENVPLNPRDSLSSQASSELTSRPPLNTIQDPSQQEVAGRSKIERTPTKPKSKASESTLPPLRTPERKYRFGWPHRNDSNMIPGEVRDEARTDVKDHTLARVGLPTATPRSVRTVGRDTSSYSECTSTRTTPTKSVSKPPSSAYRSKLDLNGGAGRTGNIGALYRGVPVAGSSTPAVVNTVEVPHFDLKEDPSFWMDHNVQVLVRVRPVNSMERSTQEYNRCLKQESAQTITWIGQPESRFTFDHVACETVDQEMLFRMAGLPMVENCLSGYNSCIFAYGQTGSGKTFTMLGEIDGLEVKPSVQRGMTPRIFEFLFARIQAEEESRRDERLQYSCKCSFLEIYNEQITDLLEPSSTNLMLREDVKAGVYVENLSEFEVHTVSDIIKLLAEGSLNRKVAATNMNRESSRSHSVFTCVIESRWEKDSTTNLRFARLNLVDLAGSERQKSSGAEGERLKEAASINKSLSTLGHVIMILVDVANGKQRHVPYRDSRLTYLLQDSLGGNSKTMIIANVSPSISCAAETLNTLKFAQRAKLIQNNAVVNEDASGDVIALQHKIRLLKEEISFLKRQNVFRSLSFDSSHNAIDPVQDNASSGKFSEMEPLQASNSLEFESKGTVRLSTKQLKSLESTLAGALRREQMAETAIKNLEAEIAQLNRLVRQREEDTRSTKMMLRFREDKIQRMESLLGGALPHDSYLMEENQAMLEETRLLQAKVDKNPEVTRFALENIRLLEQIRRFQEFYEEGEREILLDEVSKLREQLIQFLDGTSMPHHHVDMDDQTKLKNTADELEQSKLNLKSCLEENQRLSRQIDDLHKMLDDFRSAATIEDVDLRNKKDSVAADRAAIGLVNHAEEILHLQLELDILKIIFVEERSSKEEAEVKARTFSAELEVAKESFLVLNKQFHDVAHVLKETKLVLEALESDQMLAISDIEKLREDNNCYVKLLTEKEAEIMDLQEQLLSNDLQEHLPRNMEEDSVLAKKLKRMQVSIEQAKKMNTWYYNDLACQASKEAEVDEVRRQAEAETAEVIICLEQELASLQQQVQGFHLKETVTKSSMMLLEAKLKESHDKLDMLTEENNELLEKLEIKEEELRELSQEWELLACEMEEVLADGHDAVIDASHQLEEISSFLPEKRVWISEQVSRLIRTVSEKEVLVEELGKCLEDANHQRSEVDHMIKSLRSAALVINEAHEQECNEKEMEIVGLKSHLRDHTSAIAELEDELKIAKHLIGNASLCAAIGFVLAKRFSEEHLDNLNELKYKDLQLCELAVTNQRLVSLLQDHAATTEGAEAEIQSLRMEIGELKKTCSNLEEALSKEEKRASSMQLQLEVIEENDVLQTKERLAEFKAEVCSIRSCLGPDSHDHVSEINERLQACGQDDDSHGLKNVGYPEDPSNRDVTISLLKQEIESALTSLQEVRREMGTLHAEKEHFRISERQSKQSIELCTSQLLSFEAAICDFEKQFEQKVEAANHKIQAFEEIVQETMDHWSGTKECVEMEIDDAKMIAVEKAAEASCLLAKYEEAQETMKEADVMINKLMMVNESVKLELENQKQVEIALINEREKLIEEVHTLQTASCRKDQQLEDLERQFTDSMKEMTCVVGELEDIVAGLQSSSQENCMSMPGDLDSLKSFALDSRKLVSSWLEDIWSEIVVKDCAVSVLHLCHMGILLETVTGLHAENGLLQNGLCETNSVILDLKERNCKSNKELHICRTLKGKLLADIKRSFDRISRKEEEMGGFGAKLTSFEKHIFDLQLQEESMLQRSNYMGSQLAILMKELDSSNNDVVDSLLNQEKMLKDKEEYLNCQADLLILDTWSKEFESCFLASHLKDTTWKAERMIESLKEDIGSKSAEIESSRSCIEVSNMEKQALQDKIDSLEVIVSDMQADLEMKSNEVNELLSSRSAITYELLSERQDVQHFLNRVNELEDENALLQDELRSSKLRFLEAFNRLSSRNVECLNALETIQSSFFRVCSALEEGCSELVHQIFSELSGKIESMSDFIQEIDPLECSAENVASAVVSLQAELSRKDDILTGLLFDLSLLQETASNTKDQKDEIEEIMAAMEVLEDELAVKSGELDEAILNNQTLEAQLQEKMVRVAALEEELAKETESSKICSSENVRLQAAKASLELEVAQSKNLTDSLEMELSQMGDVLRQMDSETDYLQSKLNELTEERDQMLREMNAMRQQLEKAETVAEEKEAAAVAAQQEVEYRKLYAEDKEAEVKLLERSVEGLECTINVLENKVDILNDEAERQRLQREDLEVEIHSLKNQMHTFENSGSEMRRLLEEKKKGLEDALDHIETLKMDIFDKDAEIDQFKSHISELNLHAEAQASEYKQKFKQLEAMLEQVKHEESFNHAANISTTNKPEKMVVRPRGTGSPFKCIGLGLAQQVKSEKDEEMTASSQRIEELECLAGSRQKEIFALNARLAAAESMTHDVIRDLLGVKLDMTNYASLLNNQQLQKIAEIAQFSSLKHEMQDEDTMQLKKQLTEFIEERRGWIEEIDRRQTELVAAQVALENLRQQDQFLKAENEMLKMETVSHKRQVMELEGEVKKLSGQQNLQERIHHHAKIKAKNSLLKAQNEELSSKLQRSKMVLSHAKGEFKRYRSSIHGWNSSQER